MSEGHSENKTIALVTGANRGIGDAFITALLERGAKRIYAAARNREDALTIAARDPARIIPLELDIVNDAQIQKAVEKAGDINLLINNAGIANFTGVLSTPSMGDARDEMDVNYFGTLAMCRAFAPVLKQNGGGNIVSIVSILGLVTAPVAGTYCASKAALSAMMVSLRAELAAQGTQVASVYPGPVQTRMIKPLEEAMQDTMVTPDVVAKAALDGLRAGQIDIFPGTADDIRTALANDPAAVQAQFSQMLPIT